MKNKTVLAVTLVLVLFISLYLGTIVASGDVVELSGWFGVTLLVLFLIKGYQFAWQVALFIVWGNISFIVGFRLQPIHAAAIILGLFLLSSLMLGARLPKKVPLKAVGLTGLNIVMLTFLIFGVLHLGFSRVFPHIPNEFSVGNSAKAYFTTFFPVALLLFGLNTQIGFQVRQNWVRIFFIVMTMAVVGNVVYLLYLYINGFSTQDNAGLDEIGIVHIPLINAVPHHFAMRNLGPLAVLFGFGFLTSPGWWREQSFIMKIITLTIIVAGLGGSIMSGGRAAVGMCLLFFAAIAFYRKKIELIMMAFLAGVLIVVFANLFSTLINDKAPMFVARPLQYFMFEKGYAMKTIDSSQNQRNALFVAAIDDWRSAPRVTIIGRGIYRHSYTAKELKLTIGEEAAFVEVNLRAGTCHALIPSALVQYGIVGIILFLLIWVFLLRFNWKLYKLLKRQGFSQEIQSITFCLFIYNCLRIVIDLVAGGWMSVFTVIMLILIRSRMSYELSNQIESERGEQSGSEKNRAFWNHPNSAFQP